MEININHEVEDTFYRYKMPKLSAKVEGKGNGIKTVIVNMSDIAKALYRKPVYVTKFFGCELGAQTNFDEKNDRYIVNGAHDAAKLQELLHGFIKKFVLCQSCGNPETTLHVKKNGIVATSCKACGNRGQLDAGHRLTQFIIKNPPKESSGAGDKSKGKKSKKSTKNGNEQNSDEDAAHSPVAEDGQASPTNAAESDEDQDWGEDTTEEAQQQRLNELSSMARNLALSPDVEKSESERANIFFKYVSQLKRGDVVHQAREVKTEADRLELGPRAVLVVVEVLLSNPSTIVSDIPLYKSVFIPFTRIGEHAQKTQTYVLGGIAALINKHAADNLVSKACHILKALYDEDIVEEEVILSWFDKNGAKKFASKTVAAKIAEMCAPMLKWLAEAEEDSDEEGTEEDEDSQASAGAPVVAPKSAGPVSNGKIEDDEDLDIDAI